MINLKLIPDVHSIESQSENANGALIAQLVMFYIGVAAFIIVCCIPPFTLFLPFIIPIVMMVIILVNLAYFGKFIDRAVGKIGSLAETTKNIAIKSYATAKLNSM